MNEGEGVTEYSDKECLDWLTKKFEGLNFGDDWCSVDFYWADYHRERGHDLCEAISFEIQKEDEKVKA